ncbi:hypothetical protein LSTR_LSTR006048 [Laodelphax striatellus]|uniref:MSP domain-containing protein n=1 Tax=Laodelphax striatellus TaxID=195883 RepID=A0A482XQ60_LAOST|nr:hypothetical protein LSTR_LSTR006048 [Laodelphax striatellus]
MSITIGKYKKSINSDKSNSRRKTIISDTEDLKGFRSKGDFFEGSNENFGTKEDVRIDLSENSLGTTTSSFVSGEIDSFDTEESISSIQELLFYVKENEARNFDSKANKYIDIMSTEIARESYCGMNKNNRLKRNGSTMKLSKAHCICPIASTTLNNMNQELQSFEPVHEHHRISKKSQLFVFEVEPYSLLFLNCEPGKTYVKSIKIANRSDLYQKFVVSPLPKDSPFGMKIILPVECDRNTIAAGLSFRILVTYSCKGNENFKETLRIETDLATPIIIKVEAYQCPPILTELADHENFDEMTGEQFIICKSCLPTETTVTRVELVNYSKTFKFLILDKEMWSLQSLDVLCKNDNKLVTGVFTVSPAYFQTNSEASVMINIQFNPPKVGKYCKKLYIVCDNMSVKSLQLISQAYQFDKNMLQLVNMDKTYCANVKDFIQAEYFLDIGSVYRGRKKRKTFTIINKSACSLNFHWELHRYPLDGFKKMTSRMMKLSHAKGIFNGNKSKTFSVTVNMNRSATEGEYRILACLYVDNLTETKVDDLSKIKLLNRSKRKGYSLLVAIIEIHVQCKYVRIEATPQVISLERIPLLCGPQHKYSTRITVKNKSSIPVRCVWKNFISDEKIRVKLEVYPSTAKISAKTKRIFVISVTGISPGRFSQYLVCKANGNDCRIGILIKGKCTMGFLLVRDDFISCGFIRKDKKLRLDLSLENYTNCKWSRILSEYRYHSRKAYKPPKLTDSSERKIRKRFVALQYKKRGLYDNYNRLITFQYNKVNTNIEKNVIWCSLLKWKVGDAVDFVGVIVDIQRPLVTLSENEISEDYMLMNYTTIIRLQLLNHASIPASFTWCKPIGDQSSHFECKFEPASGILERHEKCQVIVYLKPLKMITIEDLYFICVVEGMVSPLLVSLTGKVQPAMMEFNWQENIAKDTEHLTAVWQCMEDNNNNNSAGSVISEDSKTDNSEELKISGSGNDLKNEAIAIDDTLKSDKTEEDLIVDDDDNNCNRSPSSNIESEYNFIGKLVIEINSCLIANKTVLQVKNCTKAAVSYWTDILSFHQKQDYIKKGIIPDENDHCQWKAMMQPDLGVVICVQSPLGQLNGYETKDLCIWAFATSWGIYHDILKIDGDGQLPTVCFELEIVCTSNPIRFPALCKPVLRLCAIHYQDDIQSYPIRVKNSCSSNILVHWSIHNILDYSRVSRKARPFKLDLSDASENVKDWGLTLNPFYGNVYLDTFSVDEPYFRLKAWSERIVTLNINPRDVKFADSADIPLALNAVLVGCVFRDPDYDQKHPKWDQSRLVAIETAHLLIKVNLDKPKLILLHDDEIESMLQFFVRGEDLWNSKNYKQSRTFVWQNQSSVATSVSIVSEEPFKIVFHKNGVKLNSIDGQISLKNGESVVMVLKLLITNGNKEIETLLEDTSANTRLFNQDSEAAAELCGPSLNKEIKYEKKMEVFLDRKLDQVHNIDLIITLPKFKLSTRKLMFEPVFIGTTKCQSFHIESEDCCPISYEIVAAHPITEEEENVFSFYPSRGVVSSRKVPSIIDVYFTPKLSVHYRMKFLVKSSIPSHELQFSVYGHGTFNSKHMGNEFPPK